MEKKDKLWRRKCNKVNLCKPQQTTSLRTILDRVSQGLPINAKIAKHTPLPPDGENMDDYDTGTEEYLDLVDVQQLDERIKEQYSKAEEAQRKVREKAKEDELNKLVESELAKRLADPSSSTQ